MEDDFAIGPIAKGSEARVIDLHKMYSDRAAAIRAVFVLLVPVALAMLAALVALRDDLTSVIVGLLSAVAVAVVAIVLFLRTRLNALIADYERQITIEQVREFKLLPLDALMSAERYQEGVVIKGERHVQEPRVFASLANVAALVGALAVTGLLFWSLVA